ncbi:MAG: hypothetical protein QM770_01325 [Tepidisphaeraceae bacterium]
MKLFFLPGYAPELNPGERVNQDAKQAMRQRRRRHQCQMTGVVRSFLRKRQKQPQVVKRFFREKQGRHLYNNKATDLLRDALRQTMSVKDRLDAVMGGNAPAFVQACLVVPFMYVDTDEKVGQVYVLNEDRLGLFETANTGTMLSKTKVEQIAKAVDMLAASNRKVFR